MLGDSFGGTATCLSLVHTVYWKCSLVDDALQTFPELSLGEC